MDWFRNIEKQPLEIVEAADGTLITSHPEDMFNVIHVQVTPHTDTWHINTHMRIRAHQDVHTCTKTCDGRMSNVFLSQICRVWAFHYYCLPFLPPHAWISLFFFSIVKTISVSSINVALCYAKNSWRLPRRNYPVIVWKMSWTPACKVQRPFPSLPFTFLHCSPLPLPLPLPWIYPFSSLIPIPIPIPVGIFRPNRLRISLPCFPCEIFCTMSFLTLALALLLATHRSLRLMPLHLLTCSYLLHVLFTGCSALRSPERGATPKLRPPIQQLADPGPRDPVFHDQRQSGKLPKKMKLFSSSPSLCRTIPLILPLVNSKHTCIDLIWFDLIRYSCLQLSSWRDYAPSTEDSPISTLHLAQQQTW